MRYGYGLALSVSGTKLMPHVRTVTQQMGMQGQAQSGAVRPETACPQQTSPAQPGPAASASTSWRPPANSASQRMAWSGGSGYTAHSPGHTAHSFVAGKALATMSVFRADRDAQA